jgi:hypothetical protein
MSISNHAQRIIYFVLTDIHFEITSSQLVLIYWGKFTDLVPPYGTMSVADRR